MSAVMFEPNVTSGPTGPNSIVRSDARGVALATGVEAISLGSSQTVRAWDLGTFSWEGRHYVLRRRVVCFSTYEYEGQGWLVQCPEFGIITFSANWEDAIREMHEEFACLYEGLVGQPDDVLTLDAIELRDALWSIVEPTR